MTASKKYPQLSEAFASWLSDRNMRLTSERQAVVSAISRHSDIFSVDDIHRELSDESLSLSLATVYNTVNLLYEAGLINAVNLAHNPQILYKVASHSIVHILQVCDKCGKVKEVSDRAIMSVLAGHSFRGFSPRTITLRVSGQCSQCSRRKKKKPVRRP